MNKEQLEQEIAELTTRIDSLKERLENRKEDVKRLIDEKGMLTEELVKAINEASKLSEVEDIYAPFKQKKRTRDTIAKEKGLEGLANIIFEQEEKNFCTICVPL